MFVVNGDKLVAKELKVGERLGDRIEIVSGVAAGEPVAMTDVDKLVDGHEGERRRREESGIACSQKSASAGRSSPRCW